ncbi:hypothetical protein A2U01_0005226 [Trifolium medium]|uniref:Uncharacterized protein n=1 Tax=Trifolium medium TaxID=97028 RepID=A0A392MDN1_9FABA|nr:hypothetical protein [Trifolium medium]
MVEGVLPRIDFLGRMPRFRFLLGLDKVLPSLRRVFLHDASRRAASSRSSSIRSNSSLSNSSFNSSSTGAFVLREGYPISTGISASIPPRNITLLAASACPFVCGCSTEVKCWVVPSLARNSWNFLYLFCPDAVGNDLRISIPYHAKGHGDDSDLSSSILLEGLSLLRNARRCVGRLYLRGSLAGMYSTRPSSTHFNKGMENPIRYNLSSSMTYEHALLLIFAASFGSDGSTP